MRLARQQQEKKQKELELKQKELRQKEQELKLRDDPVPEEGFALDPLD